MRRPTAQKNRTREAMTSTWATCELRRQVCVWQCMHTQRGRANGAPMHSCTPVHVCVCVCECARACLATSRAPPSSACEHPEPNRRLQPNSLCGCSGAKHDSAGLAPFANLHQEGGTHTTRSVQHFRSQCMQSTRCH